MKNTAKLVLSVLIVLSMAFLFQLSTHAQEAFPLTAFPATQDREVTPGQTTRAQVQFKNNSNAFVAGHIRVADYVINDKDGTPTLVEDGSLKPKYGAAAWIRTSYDAVTIAPYDFVTIDLSITPPLNADTCGRYTIVYLETQGANINFPNLAKSSSTAITSRLGTLLNLHVKKNDCREGVSVNKFEAPHFMEYGPVNLSVDLFNSGDIDSRPKGIITVTNMLGRATDQQTLKDLRIFPETARSFDTTVGQKWMFGRYKASLIATFGQSGGRVEKSVEFWVFPWKLILIALLTLIVLFILLKSLYGRTVAREGALEQEIAKEKEQIEKLKEELRNRKD